jgi:hypothetical protein
MKSSDKVQASRSANAQNHPGRNENAERKDFKDGIEMNIARTIIIAADDIGLVGKAVKKSVRDDGQGLHS